VLGQSYSVRCRAHNLNGWGAYSPLLTFIYTNVPSKPAQAVTSLENQNLRITWNEPNNNYSPILSYVVQIADKQGTFHQETQNCVKVNDLIVLETFCLLNL